MMEMRMTTDLETALPAEIGFNFEELKNELTERLHHYNTLVVTEDAIQEAKNDRANLRKLKDAIETHRKEVKKKYMTPYTIFESKVKELTALIDAPIAAIDGQVKSFEDQQRQQKLVEIEALYKEHVTEDLWDIIPLSRIFDQRWLNKSTTMKSVAEAVQTIAKRTEIDMKYLEAAVDPKHLTAVRAEYVKTLDLDKALDHRDRLMATEAAFMQREQERATYQQPVEKPAPVAAQEPVVEEPQQEQIENIYLLRLEFQLSMDQANKLKKFLVDNRINYRKI
jgi:hypothetical protein